MLKLKNLLFEASITGKHQIQKVLVVLKVSLSYLKWKLTRNG